MILLSIDPSSSITGAAIFTDESVEKFLLKPEKKSADWHVRCASMFKEIPLMVAEFKVTDIVIEDPGYISWRSAKAYGVIRSAFGMCLMAAMRTGCKVDTVQVTTWTRGRSKVSRAKVIGADADKDKGLDAADAEGLGRWWLANRSAA